MNDTFDGDLFAVSDQSLDGEAEQERIERSNDQEEWQEGDQGYESCFPWRNTWKSLKVFHRHLEEARRSKDQSKSTYLPDENDERGSKEPSPESRTGGIASGSVCFIAGTKHGRKGIELSESGLRVVEISSNLWPWRRKSLNGSIPGR